MKRSGLYSFVWAAVLASCTLQTVSDDFLGTVEGTVLVPDGMALPVTVTLSCLDDSTVADRTASVQQDGTYLFARVESGVYSVTASAPWSCEKVQSVRVRVEGGAVEVPGFSFTKEAALPLPDGEDGSSGSGGAGDDAEARLRKDFELSLSLDASGDVSRAVTVFARSDEFPCLMRYAPGIHGDEYFSAGYGTVLPGVSGAASVQLAVNGTYTFWARVDGGRVGMAVLELSSIDTEAPAPVQDVRAAFSTLSGRLEVQWESSPSDDVQHVEVTCDGPSGQSVQMLGAARTSCSFDCVPDGSLYSVSVRAVDHAGNRSEARGTKVSATVGPSVMSAWFDRSRVPVRGGSGTVTLFVSGCNFGQAKDGVFVVQLDGGDTAPHALTVTDSTSASCTFTVPEKPGTYRASVIYCDAVLRTADFSVCGVPSVASVSLAPEKVPAGKSGDVTAVLTGSDLDVCTEVMLVVSRDGKTVFEQPALPVSRTQYGCTFQSPAEEADYTVTVRVDGEAQPCRQTLQVYGELSVTAVGTAFAPLSNCGKEVELSIFGRNLNMRDDALSVSCNGRTYVPVAVSGSESRVRLAVPITSSARDFPVSVSIDGVPCGAEGLLRVQETAGYVENQFALVTVLQKSVSVQKAGSRLLPSGASLPAYGIGKFPVTCGLWRTVEEWAVRHGYGFSMSAQEDSIESMVPRTGVSWRDAVVWCNAFTEWHNAMLPQGKAALSCVYYTDSACTEPVRQSPPDGSLMAAAGSVDNPYIKKSADGYRLPTAAEWEFACRGGSASSPDWSLAFSGSAVPDDVAWCLPLSGGVLHEAGQKRPNALGIFDMSGNVWEWVEDWSSSNVLRMLRGGSFASPQADCGPSSEGIGKLPYLSDAAWGFRVARSK